MKRPRTIYVSPGALNALRNPDTLSCDALVFRNGGRTNEGEALPYIEATPELLAWLRAQSWELPDRSKADG